MTNEELLQPRYKVIADYPNSPFMIGMIYNYGDRLPPPGVGGMENYPHLFRKLEWWEERKAEDMPEYVKENVALTLSGKQSVLQVKYYSGDGWFETKNKIKMYSCTVFLPATKEEYENQEP